MEAGQVHVMGEIPPQDALQLESSGIAFLYQVQVPGQPLQFFLNTERPPTDDLLVRQAILFAADRQAIASTLFQGYSPVAYGPLSAQTMGFEPAVRESYGYDQARATALLDQAGWIDSDGDGIRDRASQPLALQACLMGWGYLPEVGQMLRNQLSAVGIYLQLQQLDFEGVMAAAHSGECHLAPVTFSSSDPSVLNLTYLSVHADGGFNWSNVRDAELDRLLHEGVSALDPAHRAGLYAQAQMRIMSRALVLPIRDYVNLNAAHTSVSGLAFDRRGWFPWLYDVYLEP
jgi:peptide/nickel transport system substrate-binding protein